MALKQINLKLPEKLIKAAESYVEAYGYRNIQDLAADSLREKLFEKNDYDETFFDEEIALIDEIITLSLKKKDFVSEEELNEALLK